MGRQHYGRDDRQIIAVLQTSVSSAMTDAQGGLIGSGRMVEHLMQAVSRGHVHANRRLLAQGFGPDVIAEVLHRHDLTLHVMLCHLLRPRPAGDLDRRE